MYPNIVHVATVEGNRINKFADLKGKRVSTGSPGSGTEIVAFRMLEAAGLYKDPYRTTLQAWKCTMPAFVVPFMFVLAPEGVGLLLKTPPGGNWLLVAWIAR